jgi:hypothetical protein
LISSALQYGTTTSIYDELIIYFLRFPARVGVPASGCTAAVVEGVLEAEALVDEAGDEVSKLNVKREDRGGVEGPSSPMMTDLLPTSTEIDLKCSPTPPAVEDERVALPRKLILSTDMWKSVACPAMSVSTSTKKTFDGHIGVVRRNRFLSSVLVGVEARLDRQDG